jgi:hypothetical protein
MTAEYEIELLIADFFRAFDAHDWPGVRGTLADELKIDYATPRGGRPSLVAVNPDSFVSQRRNALSTLRTNHDLELQSLWIEDDTATAKCTFALKRYSRDGERHFHSWGEFELAFAKHERRGWRISSLAQMTWRSEGEPKLHAVGAAERKIA